jgi:hypothetical protein
MDSIDKITSMLSGKVPSPVEYPMEPKILAALKGVIPESKSNLLLLAFIKYNKACDDAEYVLVQEILDVIGMES